MIHESEGENVALVPLVYDALRVTDCPAWMLVALAVNVHEFHQASPVQSVLQCPGVPFNAQSSQTSFGLIDRVCHGKNIHPWVCRPPFPSEVPVALSVVPSPHLAT